MLSSLKLTKVFSQLKVARKQNRKKKNGDQGVLFQPSYRSSWPTWSTAIQISWKKQRSHEKSWEFNLTHDRSFIIPHDVIRKPYATALNVFDHHNLAQNWNYCGALITPDKPTLLKIFLAHVVNSYTDILEETTVTWETLRVQSHTRPLFHHPPWRHMKTICNSIKRLWSS